MAIADILESISLIIAAWAVIIGVNAWRREYIGKKRHELAEEVLTLFYQARDVIRSIRNPFGYVGEGSTRKASADETPEEKAVNDRAFVVIERYNKNQELFNKIYSMRYRYMAQFGKESAKPFDDLHRIIRDIFAASYMLSHYWLQQGRRTWRSEEEFQQHLESMRENEAVFWEKSADNDLITQRVDTVISDIETRCLAIINKQTVLKRIGSWFRRQHTRKS